MDWQLQDAKNRFSEVVSRARTEGPQVVTLRGRRTAVVLSVEHFDQLTAARPSLRDHLLSGAPWDDSLINDIGARDRRGMRDIDL